MWADEGAALDGVVRLSVSLPALGALMNGTSAVAPTPGAGTQGGGLLGCDSGALQMRLHMS